MERSSSVLLDSGSSDIAYLAGDLDLMLSAPGDYDCDGDVDLGDYGEFRSCLAGPTDEMGSGCDVFDADGDSRIDLVDWNALQRAFTGSWP